MSEEFKNVPAFNRALVQSQYPHKEFKPLYEFEDSSRFVVREVTLETLKEEDAGIERVSDAAVRVKKLFDELHDFYGVHAPVHFVAAKNDKNEPCLYIIVDNVEEIIPEEMSGEA